MPKLNKKIPLKWKYLLWSYDIKSIDPKRDREYIVTQVLNYGIWEDIKLLFKLYSEKEIKEVIKEPGRGLWFKKVLDFWLLMFDLKTKRDVYQRAIFDLNPYKKRKWKLFSSKKQ